MQGVHATSPREGAILSSLASSNVSSVPFVGRLICVFTRSGTTRCLNRYYVAEGVRLYSLTTWKEVVGSTGRYVSFRVIDWVLSLIVMHFIENLWHPA